MKSPSKKNQNRNMKQRGFWRVFTGFSFVSVAGNGNPLAGTLQHQQKKGTTPRLFTCSLICSPKSFFVGPQNLFTQKFPLPPRLKFHRLYFLLVAANGPGLTTIIPKGSLLHAHPLGCCQVQTPRVCGKVRPQTGFPAVWRAQQNGCGCFWWSMGTFHDGNGEVTHLSATVDGRTPANHLAYVKPCK